MSAIDHMGVKTGRHYKEDGSITNLADKIDAIYEALIVNKDAGVQLNGRNVAVVTLANAVAIADTENHEYNLRQIAGLTADDLRQYTEFKISINSTLDVTYTLEVFEPSTAANVDWLVTPGIIFSKSAISGGCILSAHEGGEGATTTTRFVVPALQGVLANLLVRVRADAVPNSGSVTIMVEMRR